MPGPRLPMRRIRDVLRLSAAGMSKRQIAASLGVSATAAGECIRRARRAGLAWPLPDELSDEELERRLLAATKALLAFGGMTQHCLRCGSRQFFRVAPDR